MFVYFYYFFNKGGKELLVFRRVKIQPRVLLQNMGGPDALWVRSDTAWDKRGEDTRGSLAWTGLGNPGVPLRLWTHSWFLACWLC